MICREFCAGFYCMAYFAQGDQGIARAIEGHVPDAQIIAHYVGAKHLRHT